MYDYNKERKHIFTDDGQRKFLEIRDIAQTLLNKSGAFKMNFAFSTGSSWFMMACVDRMVELGELKELLTEGNAQDRVFIKKKI